MIKISLLASAVNAVSLMGKSVNGVNSLLTFGR